MAFTLGRKTSGDPVPGLLMRSADNNPDGRLITNGEGKIIYANDSFHRLFVSDGGQVSSLNDLAVLLKDRGDMADAFARLRANAAVGIAGELDFPISLSRGAAAREPVGRDLIEWRRIQVSPLLRGRASERRPDERFALWRCEDITARNELDAIRRQQEEMLVDFIDNLPVGFFSADSEGRILYANKSLSDWLSLSPSELNRKEMRFSDFVVMSGPQAPSSFMAGHEEDADHMNGEVTLKGADGKIFRASLIQSVQPAHNGDVSYTRSVLMRGLAWRQDGDPDGTDSAQRLHWLFKEAPVGIVLLDLNGEVTDCNRAFLKLLGLHRDAVVGRPLTERMTLEDRSDVSAQLSKVVMGIMPATHLEVRMPGAGQRELVASLFASRMEDEGGEVSGLILHFIDATEQKHLEIQFAQSQKIQAVGQLAGGVAHDFNNLLTAMIGFCDLLLERHGPDNPSFADIMQIKQNANRATNLVRQLLAFSRKQTLQPEILDTSAALSDLSNLLGRLIGESIVLKMEHGRNLGLVRVDPGQFDQVIINLAVNSRDAMPGGGTLTIRTSDVTVDEPVQRGAELMPAGGYVLIEVSDSGTGIAKEDIGRIFEPFFTTKEVGAGTGLGLSTVYGIVRQTGGFIFVDSASGKGTTFKIYLPHYETVDLEMKNSGWPDSLGPEPELNLEHSSPAPQAARGIAARDEHAEGDLTGTGTVLLVEDEDAVRMFGARALRNKGYRVLEAHNGEGALDLIKSNGGPIDLIISDVVMPGMDGHTLVRLVRQERPRVRIILMSGYAEDALSEEIHRDPTINFLPKPFTLKILAGMVKDVMEA